MTGEALPPNLSTLAQVIKDERAELMEVHAMLKCLYEVLLYADDDDSVMHADVANVSARLINESVCRLDQLHMQWCAPKRGDEFDESGLSESGGSEG